MAGMLQNLAGLGDMTEQVIASDLLISSKSAIKQYASALAETATPEVGAILKRQFDAAVVSHQKITKYMMDKGFYFAYEPSKQIRMDLEASDNVLGMDQ